MICMMSKQCIHCHRTYNYNPSVGDLGTVCKYCHRPQVKLTPVKLPRPVNEAVPVRPKKRPFSL